MGDSPSPRYILIGSRDEGRWSTLISGAVSESSILETVDEQTAMPLIVERDYEAIFIDVSAVDDFSLLISRIRAQRPDARVIVIASQDWKQAREAFLSGATDYIRKSQPKADLIASVREALVRPVLIACAAGGGW